MSEKNATENVVEFGIEEKGVNGKIYVKDDEIYVAWYEYEPEDSHRVLQAIGKALGYPVVIAEINSSGNGHYSAILRKATEEEASTQIKIAQCRSLEYLTLPKYKQAKKMREEAGNAILALLPSTNESHSVWIFDTSKINLDDFLLKWTNIAFQDGVEAAKTGNWKDAHNASSLAFMYGAKEKDIEISALFITTAAQIFGAASTTVNIIMCCQELDTQSAQKLQECLNEFCVKFKLAPTAFDIKTIIKKHLDKHPEKFAHNKNLVKIVEN